MFTDKVGNEAILLQKVELRLKLEPKNQAKLEPKLEFQASSLQKLEKNRPSKAQAKPRLVAPLVSKAQPNTCFFRHPKHYTSAKAESSSESRAVLMPFTNVAYKTCNPTTSLNPGFAR